MSDNETQYGIFDTKDNCWIGNEDGPKLFGEEESKKANGMPPEVMAKIAAQVIERQLGWRMGRLRERPFDQTTLRRKDTVDAKMTPLEALKRVEEGRR